ncbi:TlpA family protein disulfide reductase [Pedobacter sp. GR22-6]|uniref:TlpA family protein disulfide reductase n=1 Tax=Pedobacter sp. GR22-6 TaxID=3127957 RepID=UPI00307EDA4F
MAFNRDYFATHRVDPFVSEQADIEQRYGLACIYVNVLLREKIQDPGMLDFFKANQIIFDNPQALANQRYQTFIDQYYFLVRYKALDGDQGVTVTGNQIAQYILQPDKGFSEEAKRDARRFLDTLNYPADKHSNNLFYEKYVAPLVPSYVADSEHNLPEFDYVLGLKDPYLRDVYATKTLYKYLSPTKIAFIKPNLKAYREGVASTVLKKRFLNDYERMYDELYHSKVPPKAILHDAAQLDAKDPLGSILSKYKGKVVYVDVWATWCAPCIAEMPNSRVLREKMSGKDIVFVYLCVSSAQEKSWKELVASQNMEGENYFLKRELYSPIANQLEIKTIPRYFIVDKTGYIVDKNARRPGDPATLKQLNDLLVQ